LSGPDRPHPLAELLQREAAIAACSLEQLGGAFPVGVRDPGGRTSRWCTTRAGGRGPCLLGHGYEFIGGGHSVVLVDGEPRRPQQQAEADAAGCGAGRWVVAG